MRHASRSTLTAALIILGSFSPAAFAADLYFRFLLPLNVRNVPGAHGSRWTSETWLQHTAGAFVTVIPTPFCFGFMCVDSLAIDPGFAAVVFRSAVSRFSCRVSARRAALPGCDHHSVPHPALWVEVVPITTGLRIWAMISVTNNDTQHVTLIAP